MNRSPLHGLHEELGARFTEFGGWDMPVRYGSILEEHRTVRRSAGFFDVSHLGRFALSGPGSRTAVSRLLSNDPARIAPGRCQYTMMLNERGGIVDDIIVWWLDDELFWVMPNAVNQSRVMEAFAAQEGCAVTDLQKGSVFLAVQGPQAPEVLQEILGEAPRRFRNIEANTDGGPLRLAGTGYTGERGAELFAEPEAGEWVVRRLLDAGVTPCGLGSRDTLRLEAGLPLWGSDIDESTTPLEARLDFAVSFDHDFVGRAALERQKEQGLDRALAGFVLDERGIPRAGHRIRTPDGTGTVTSGNTSPMLETGIGLAYVSPPAGETGPVEVEVRDRWLAGHLASPPFHVDA